MTDSAVWSESSASSTDEIYNSRTGHVAVSLKSLTHGTRRVGHSRVLEAIRTWLEKKTCFYQASTSNCSGWLMRAPGETTPFYPIPVRRQAVRILITVTMKPTACMHATVSCSTTNRLQEAKPS
jgi:GDP-D-mannose dehydratase